MWVRAYGALVTPVSADVDALVTEIPTIEVLGMRLPPLSVSRRP